MVHRRELEGEVLVFGNQGALSGNAMTWWDHDTGTVWSQPLGEAIVGPRKGATLELLSSRLTQWDTWREDHPDTVALDAPGQPSRFDLASMSIVVNFSDEVGVYPIRELTEHGPANDIIAGVPVAVVVDPLDRSRWKVLHRQVGERVVTLSEDGDTLVDVESGTVWDPATGVGLEGELEGEVLNSLPGFTSFESDARTFWPEARFWSP